MLALRARPRGTRGQGLDDLVLVSCPDCLAPEERAQVGERKGASVYEVASARQVSAD